MSETLQVDDLTISIKRSDRRRTIEFTIERDNSITLVAPADVPVEELERVARGKRLALHTKLAERAAFSHPPKAKEYVSGEGFYYLGRSYRLALLAADGAAHVPPLRLSGDRFLLRRDEREHAARHFISWYIEHGQEWLERPVARLAERAGVSVGAVRIQDLGYRWGSCGPRSGLNFHWRTMQLPPRIIEYVIAHELVHLIEPRHSREYWRRLGRVMPDYETRKEWLAEHGREF